MAVNFIKMKRKLGDTVYRVRRNEMIQTFRPVYDVEACLAQIRECLEKGWAGAGYKTVEFEEAWKRYTGFPYAHFVANGTAALNLSLMVLKEKYGWDDETEIISTPITFVATNNAILVNHMNPVFADVDDTLCLDPVDVERKITDRTRAVIFVGLGGNTGKYKQIVELCRKHHLSLILDAAHMTGTRLGGVMPGKEADVVCYSFHVTKNLSTADSGMVCFMDVECDDKVRRLSWNGMDKTSSPKKYNKHYVWKINVDHVVDAYNGTSIMAGIALAQLPHVDEENEYRRKIAGLYDKYLLGVNGVTLVNVPDECESARWLYQILVDDRDGLMEYAKERGVSFALHYLDNSEYPMYEHLHGICPHAEYVSDHAVSLPMHLLLKEEDVVVICGIIKDFVSSKR